MGKIIHEDGRITYYYYKKKKGRHKKTGPKKKKKVKNVYKKACWDFKIVKCDFRKQTDYIGKYHDVGEVNVAKKKLLEENDNVEFPLKYVNNKRINKGLYEYLGEYLVLKRKSNATEKTSLLRNAYGKMVEHTLTSDKWVIYDKFPYVKEETFWVYGYNPKTNRKTFNYIYTTFIDNIINNTYNLVQVYIYNNKVIFRYDGDEIEFVVCKNVSDAIRMYNLLEDKYAKSKQVFFTGFTSKHDDRAKEIIRLIQDKSGWDIKKIYKRTTS